MNKALVVIIAIVNVLALLISGIVLFVLQSQIASRSSSLNRVNEVIDMINEQQRVASLESNFANLHLSILSAAGPNSAVMSSAGMSYHHQLQSLVVAGYDEQASDQSNYLSLKAEVDALASRFSEDFTSAMNESGVLQVKIMQAVTENIETYKQRRTDLAEEKEALQGVDLFVRFGLSALQFFSLLLVLVRDLVKKS